MTPDEFEFWQKAYLAALTALLSRTDCVAVSITCLADTTAKEAADMAVLSYRTAKATVPDND
jgi:hypothetical protein